MQVVATFISSEKKEIQELFYKGQQAVLKEGGGGLAELYLTSIVKTFMSI